MVKRKKSEKKKKAEQKIKKKPMKPLGTEAYVVAFSKMLHKKPVQMPKKKKKKKPS
jgi:hypothetical protein